MQDPRTNRQWRLIQRPQGRATREDFEWREEAVPEPTDGEFLVRNIYLSLDPAQRGWMNEGRSYTAPAPLGSVMLGGTIGIVAASKSNRFSEGQIVTGPGCWQDFCVTDGKGWTPLDPQPGVPLTAFLGVLGHIGMTAYFGLLDVGKPQAGETLVVSAAAGAVGSVTGQIGKIKGCRVVGIAGTDEKCRWIVEELGFDAAVNYKTEPVYETLKEHCPEGIDIQFENVGGEILEAGLALIRQGGRIVLCGMISQYNDTEPRPGPSNLIRLLVQRARIEGFIILDYLHRAAEAMRELGGWLASGQLKYRVDIVPGLENSPEALNRLFDGTHRGKLIVQVGEEP